MDQLDFLFDSLEVQSEGYGEGAKREGIITSQELVKLRTVLEIKLSDKDMRVIRTDLGMIGGESSCTFDEFGTWVQEYLLRGICIHNKTHNLHLILGLNSAHIFPGVGTTQLRRKSAKELAVIRMKTPWSWCGTISRKRCDCVLSKTLRCG